MYKLKVLFSIIVGMFWIYFRKYENYRALPNYSIVSCIIVGGWILANYLDPLALPLGLLGIYIYSRLYSHQFSL